MRKKLSKYLVGIAAVVAVLAIGSFPAFALGASPMALVAAATTAATPFATQVKLLAISGSVYALLQAVKQVFPLAGLGAVLSNIALSVFGVIVVIKPEDLFSLNTLTLVGIAAITAAGAHGTIKSFAGGGGSPTGPTATVALLCLALIVMPFTTGCSQAQVVGAMQKVDTGLKIAKGVIPQANLILQELQQVDPEAAEYFTPLLQKADPALDKLIAAAEAYIANPGSDAYQAVLNGVDAFTAQVDQAALGTVGIKNPQSQAKVVGWIAVFSTGLHVTLGILETYATSKQKKAVPTVSARVSFDQIRPFLDRSYAHDELAAMGYSNPDQILTYAGF